ncbi:MFS transporter [Paenibacillus aurantiacus]|uniref:MFS transporter n=1 Tax=Paenibacillus aurantiacus TaxID=1936118 RepID=A0ABV5L1I9_9BACL
MKEWRKASLLFVGFGFSNLGNWIYFVAINLIVLNLTGSAAALAGLFVIRPLAMLLTNFWSGSVIDRVNVRKLMILVDVARGGLICCMAWASSLWSIYALMLAVNMFGAFFGPSSSVYITKVIPEEDKPRFNAVMGMINSSAFLVGPAVSGVLMIAFDADACILINGLSFFACAGMIYALPDADNREGAAVRERLTYRMLIRDFREVTRFAGGATLFVGVYVLFQASMLVAYAIDSQEATFIKLHLNLSEVDYGTIISVTGIGSLAGSALAAAFAKRIPYRWYMGLGLLLGTFFYVTFYASYNYLTAAASFVLLGFCMAFSGAGFATFFQRHVPAEVMGRFSSIADLISGIAQVALTLSVGLLADLLPLQLACLAFAGLSLLLAFGVCVKTLAPSRAAYFEA